MAIHTPSSTSALIVSLHYHIGPREEAIPVGLLSSQDGKIAFTYTPEFMITALQLSPLHLPLKPDLQANTSLLFGGLFGLFNDSLPDGWGRWLFEVKCIQLGIDPSTLSPLDRLQYLSKMPRHKVLGALIYGENPSTQKETPTTQNLDTIANQVNHFQKTSTACETECIEDLLLMNGSANGARPKVLITIENRDWIVKFRSSIDPQDIGAMEYAYHLMAKASGLDVPSSRLFPAKKGSGYFGVERFDQLEGRPLHMHTISGLLHADHRLPCLDYEAIMKATAWLTKDIQQCAKQFRACAFNVLSYNRDDHAKNFSFLMSEKGEWTVSPAYDLTFSSGPSGEHSSTIMGEGKTPTTSHLLRLAEIGGLPKKQALTIIDEVKGGVAQWSSIAKEQNVSKSSRQRVQEALDHVRNSLG